MHKFLVWLKKSFPYIQMNICIHLCLSFCIGMASAVVNIGNLCTTNLTSTSYTYQAKRKSSNGWQMENCLLGFEINSKAFMEVMEKYKTECMYIRIGVEIVFLFSLGFFLWGGGVDKWLKYCRCGNQPLSNKKIKLLSFRIIIYSRFNWILRSNFLIAKDFIRWYWILFRYYDFFKIDVLHEQGSDNKLSVNQIDWQCAVCVENRTDALISNQIVVNG